MSVERKGNVLYMVSGRPRSRKIFCKRCVSTPFAIFLLLLFALMQVGFSNDYLRASHFDTVTVREGDSAGAIASRYTEDAGRRAKLVEAIIDINALTPDGSIRAGQSLKVPLLKEAQQETLVAGNDGTKAD